MIYMPDREQVRLVLERDALGGWSVVSPTHGMLYAEGATRADALAGVEPALAQLDKLDAALGARGLAPPAPEPEEELPLAGGALALVLVCVAMWALMLTGAGAILRGFGW